MYSVYLNNEGFEFKDFRDNLLSICKQHQLENRASAFAFIIYDFENAHLRQILDNRFYWESLNDISGKYLTIFSLFENPTKSSLQKMSSQFSSTMSFDAHKIRTDKNIEVSYKEIIDTFFGGTKFSTPSILFFQVNKDAITDHFLVELKKDKIEDGFNELKEIIKESIETVKAISSENMKNYGEIFDMIQVNVENSLSWKRKKTIAGKIISFINFLSIFK